MRFWDSSALVPLLVDEAASSLARSLLREDPAIVAWRLAGTEVASALWRRRRAGEIDEQARLFAEGGLARAAAGLNPQLNLRLINAINTDALAESMAQSRGLEQTILNVIDRNGSFLRQRIGGA